MLTVAAHLCEACGVRLLGRFRKPVTIRSLCGLLETTGLF
jgi:hypothetical protein